MIVNAIIKGEKYIMSVGLSAAPCGHCRQFFAELNSAVVCYSYKCIKIMNWIDF